MIHKGSRRKGDDEGVRGAFQYWIEDGLADAEAPSELDSLNAEDADNPQNIEVQLSSEPTTYSAPDLLVLAKDVRAGVGIENGRAARVVEIKAGTIFLSNSELVQLRRDLFREPNGRRR